MSSKPLASCALCLSFQNFWRSVVVCDSWADVRCQSLLTSATGHSLQSYVAYAVLHTLPCMRAPTRTMAAPNVALGSIETTTFRNNQVSRVQ